jgi:hypothetical protein
MTGEGSNNGLGSQIADDWRFDTYRQIQASLMLRFGIPLILSPKEEQACLQAARLLHEDRQ